MPSAFRRLLEDRLSKGSDSKQSRSRARARRWLFVPYDQLSDRIGPLSREAPEALGIVMVETLWKPGLRPYHKQKLAMVLASQRHFALEQAERGVDVRYLAGEGAYSAQLEPFAREHGPLRMMRAAERELRRDLAPLVEQGLIEELEHEGWLTTRAWFDAQLEAAGSSSKPLRWRMDAFYRHVRRETGLLMEDGKPRGGKFSFDPENRKAWRGEPPEPAPPTFPVDEIKTEVCELIERRFAEHPGHLDVRDLPATAKDAERAWRFAKRHCLPEFGPFEDAMSDRARTLFHTRISALLHNHRLLPARVVQEVASLDLPLASQEGFIRQVLGWREFMHHVHEATDGFRQLPKGVLRKGTQPAVAEQPGDGGWSAWRGRAWRSPDMPIAGDGGARPSVLGARGGVPPAFWGEPSGLHCLDTVVREVWETGYGHHITRLMVLSNLATLLDVSPRELTDWFWVAYTDAYDWVVEPNVLGMGSFGLGDLFTTKPYVSGAAYIHKMSDYCSSCDFSPKACPITSLYWQFLDRHENALSDNPRMAMPLRSLGKRAAKKRRHDRRVFDWVQDVMSRSGRLTPEAMPGADAPD